ncbi:hypothetical protein BDN71DRAFT_1591561 [Pleurotus eryngii]|uniref:F-box domain-containing protein n=1 Tax=Pleurotus eryngii TaxID=5323 RepID=A0A9P5ZTY5_PLEER|nr:hypothetical protein BDN71DRAFT_1591561 [Pleurotus eryngii]
MAPITGKDVPSAVSRFVDTTELLEDTLKSLSPEDLRKTITVSRQWAEVSLDVRWREVDSVSSLRRGLALIERDRDDVRLQVAELQCTNKDIKAELYIVLIGTVRAEPSGNCPIW